MNKMIPSEEWSSLNKGIHTDENGNVVIGKNLEVDGTTKMNSGIEPIHSYRINDTSTFYVYFEQEVQYQTFSAFGLLQDSNAIFSQIGIAKYILSDGALIGFNFTGNSNFILRNGNLNELYLAYKGDLTNLQPKLYRHILTINATTKEGDPLTSIISHESSNNLKVDSLQDLTTLLKPTANYNYPIGAVINTALGGIYQDYNLLEYSNNVWKFASSHSSTTKINVSSVSDVVTTL